MSHIETQTEIVKKKKGRPKIYTENEATELRRERIRTYQNNRYHTDAEFRQRKIDTATKNNANQYNKLKIKLQKLKELEAVVNSN